MPGYAFCYVFNAISVSVYLVMYLNIVLLYLGVCIYTVSLYDDLSWRLSQLDDVHYAQRTEKIKSCLQYHIDLLRWVHQLLYHDLCIILFV